MFYQENLKKKKIKQKACMQNYKTTQYDVKDNPLNWRHLISGLAKTPNWLLRIRSKP